EAVMRVSGLRIPSQHATVFLTRSIEHSHGTEQKPEVVVRGLESGIELDGPSVPRRSLIGGPRFGIEMGQAEVGRGVLRQDSASLLEYCDRFFQFPSMSEVRRILLVGKRHAVTFR